MTDLTDGNPPAEPLTAEDRALLDDLRSREPQVVPDEPERTEPPGPAQPVPDPLTPLFQEPPAAPE